MSLRDLTLGSFGEALASSRPTPGGGSASALAGSLASALVAMVARTTAGSKKFADRAAQMESIAREADALRTDLLVLVDEDAAAFDQVMQAIRLPKTTAEEQAARAHALQDGYRAAIGPPMKVCDGAVRALELAVQVAEAGTPSAASDAGVAALLASAALEGGALNVRINQGSVTDQTYKDTLTARLQALSARGKQLRDRALALVEVKLA